MKDSEYIHELQKKKIFFRTLNLISWNYFYSVILFNFWEWWICLLIGMLYFIMKMKQTVFC